MLFIPTECPICSSILERVNDQLFCRNDYCEAKSSKKLLHFIKTVKIKGLGEKTLEKLDIQDIPELYWISKQEFISKLGEKIGTKIYNEVNKSKNISLELFIQSFGIPLIGNSASTKLAKCTDSIWNITKDVCESAGLGEKATSNLLQWIKTNRIRYSDVPITTSRADSNEVEELFNICITGKLNDYSSRTKAKDFLEAKGIKVLSSISKKAKYLICDIEETSSSSYLKAQKLNIPIISMNHLLNIINGEIND